jgi:hypothetical protein
MPSCIKASPQLLSGDDCNRPGGFVGCFSIAIPLQNRGTGASAFGGVQHERLCVMISLADAAGFAGSALILLAFGYVNMLRRAPDMAFNLANFAGAALLAVSLSINYNLPALLLECAWMVIATFGIVTGLRRKAG